MDNFELLRKANTVRFLEYSGTGSIHGASNNRKYNHVLWKVNDGFYLPKGFRGAIDIDRDQEFIPILNKVFSAANRPIPQHISSPMVIESRNINSRGELEVELLAGLFNRDTANDQIRELNSILIGTNVGLGYISPIGRAPKFYDKKSIIWLE